MLLFAGLHLLYNEHGMLSAAAKKACRSGHDELIPLNITSKLSITHQMFDWIVEIQ